MDEIEDFADFSDEDVVSCIEGMLTSELKEIFNKIGLSPERVLKELDKNVEIDAFEEETLQDYSTRCLEYIMLNKLTRSISKKVMAEGDKTSNETVDPEKMEQFLDNYLQAYSDGEVDKMSELIEKYGIIPVIENDELSGISMNAEQKKQCDKILRTYTKKFEMQIAKLNLKEEKSVAEPGEEKPENKQQEEIGDNKNVEVKENISVEYSENELDRNVSGNVEQDYFGNKVEKETIVTSVDEIDSHDVNEEEHTLDVGVDLQNYLRSFTDNTLANLKDIDRTMDRIVKGIGKELGIEEKMPKIEEQIPVKKDDNTRLQEEDEFEH